MVSGALKWTKEGAAVRFADGYAPGSYYKLRRARQGLGGPIWDAWYFNADGEHVKLGQGNFIQARGYAIVHHHQQKKEQ